MSSEPQTSLKGEVYYLPRIALPSNCTLTVKLEDISLADAPAKVLAITQTNITRSVPLPFELLYNTSLLVSATNTYVLSARIEHQGRLIWINDTLRPVELTGANQEGLHIKVTQVSNGSTGGLQGNNGISGGLQGNNGISGGLQGNNGISGGLQGNNGISGGLQGNNGISGGLQGNNGISGGLQGNNGTDHN